MDLAGVRFGLSPDDMFNRTFSMGPAPLMAENDVDQSPATELLGEHMEGITQAYEAGEIDRDQYEAMLESTIEAAKKADPYDIAL